MGQKEDRIKDISNPYIQDYLELMQDTETPPILHTWSLISAVAACLGRRCYFPLGPLKIMPNQFIMLIGAPGIRKSTSIIFMRALLEELDDFRLGPNNTAGRLQGLLSAMAGSNKSPSAEDADMAEAFSNMGASLTDNFGLDVEMEGHVLNKNALYIAEGELASFLGVKQSEFITFLTDMWDKAGEETYTYALRKETITIRNPCLNVIGAITPMHLVNYLPPEAIGQGFTSRVIMVYADEAKTVPWPAEISKQRLNGYKAIFGKILSFEGAFSYTLEAKKRIIELHIKGYTPIDDARFIHYIQRRQAHTIKVAMALAALRMSQEVALEDVNDADLLLSLTEARMHESLGEYGMNPVALAKARIIEMLEQAKEPLTGARIKAMVGGDVGSADTTRAIYDLMDSSSILELHVKDDQGFQRVAYWVKKQLTKHPSKVGKDGTVKVTYSTRPEQSLTTKRQVADFIGEENNDGHTERSIQGRPSNDRGSQEEARTLASLANQERGGTTTSKRLETSNGISFPEYTGNASVGGTSGAERSSAYSSAGEGNLGGQTILERIEAIRVKQYGKQ